VLRPDQKDVEEMQRTGEAIKKEGSVPTDSQVESIKHHAATPGEDEVGRGVGTEGKDALGPRRQVLERSSSLGKAATLGASEPGKGEPEEEVTTSDEEMQEEIREAQAAVDKCYRRRAEHTGIKVKAPRNRLMTEEELDCLREQLGDGTGAWAKRRREIEWMSIAEMEAEAEEVQEEIKRRKGRKASRLPLVLMLFCLSGQAVKGFTAYDCSNRSNILESYLLLEHDSCANMGNSMNQLRLKMPSDMPNSRINTVH
jgi:hypothetical protein